VAFHDAGRLIGFMPLLKRTFPSGAKIIMIKMKNAVFNRKTSVLVGTQAVDMWFVSCVGALASILTAT
jgi:hypothetical protein